MENMPFVGYPTHVNFTSQETVGKCRCQNGSSVVRTVAKYLLTARLVRALPQLPKRRKGESGRLEARN
jgi:hypothetical protein